MKISIITATYNSGKTVKDTLDSVLKQNYTDYELIIKDGGSKDNTLDICRAYEPKFKGKMRIISTPDKGIYDAMNQGIQAAKGDVVGILNSDDLYEDEGVL
ncbi:MAG: glycosyltransferase, partial [Mediterranea sp.]|nr:glycosyltransferase [Mediterranea sp.]